MIATPTFTGNVDSDIVRVLVSVNGVTETDHDVSSGSFSIPVGSVPDGAHTVTITYFDRAGNSHTATQDIDIKHGFDSNPTVNIPGFNVVNGIRYGQPDNLTLNGTGDPDTSVRFTINGVNHNTTIDADGNWSIDLSDQTFAEDVFFTTVYFSYKYGNYSHPDYVFFFDSTPPNLSVEVIGEDLDPSSDVLLNQDSATLQGQTGSQDTISVSVNGVSTDVTVESNGSWSYDLTGLNEGANTIIVTATDRAGNETTNQQNITVDTQTSGTGDLLASSDTGASDSDGITSDTTPSFSGTGEVGATVTLTISGQAPLTAVVDASGNWSIDVTTPLAAGSYT